MRRCYRFGQKKPVSVHLVLSDGERRIADNLNRKKEQVETMFRELVCHMQDSLHLVSRDAQTEAECSQTILTSHATSHDFTCSHVTTDRDD